MQLVDQNHLDKHQGSSKGHAWPQKLMWLKLPKFWMTKVLYCQSFLQLSDMLFMSRGEFMGSSAVQQKIKALPGRSPESGHCCCACPIEPPCWLLCMYGLCTKTLQWVTEWTMGLELQPVLHTNVSKFPTDMNLQNLE